MFQAAMLLAVSALIKGPMLQNGRVPANDPHIRYVGRFDFQEPDGPRCAWPASTVEIRFRGTRVSAKVKDGGKDSFEVVVDGKVKNVLQLQSGTAVYTAADGLLDGPHTLDLVKRTETFVGTTQFLEFYVGGTLLPVRKPKRILEVIGDSISCGYGNEGLKKEEHFSNLTENAYLTYGALAAKNLHADFIDIAWSGRKMWPDNTIPEIYDLALPDTKNSLWDLKQQIPGVIVINLATNDFGRGIPDEKGWTEAYAAFIGRLRQRAPQARIYVTMGPMMTDTYPPRIKALSTLRTFLKEVIDLRTALGDKNISLIEFETQNEARDGIGSDWHPNLKTHQNMADRLSAAIHTDLGW